MWGKHGPEQNEAAGVGTSALIPNLRQGETQYLWDRAPEAQCF